MKQFAIIAAILCVFTANAQNQKTIERQRKMCEEIKSKPLYVVLEVENEKFEAKLLKKNKEQELKNYKRAIAEYNSYIKGAVSGFFDIFPSVKYISPEDYKNMKDKELKTVNILLRTFPTKTKSGFVDTNSGFNGGNNFGVVSVGVTLEDVAIDTNNVEEESIVAFKTWVGDELMPLFSQHLNKLFCSKDEVYFAVREIRKMIENGIKNNSKEESDAVVAALKTKTLMINKNSLSPGLTDVDIKSVYGNPFKIATQAEYENCFLLKDEHILLLIVIPCITFAVSPDDMHCIFDPSTNASIWADRKKCTGPVKKEHFEWYSKPMF